MFNVYIIGAGQIGSRHLQALKNVKFPLGITVIDPSEQSLAIARQRYEEMPENKYLPVGRRVNHTVKYLKQIDIGHKIDLAIIATASNVRAKAVKDILKHNRVSCFILEKILFDKKSDYFAIENIFSKSKIKAWVNCARRVRPIYKHIKEDLSDRVISFRGIGSKWGLACNAVQFLDLVSFLTGDYNFVLDTHLLDKKIYPSKRRGFLEINGTLCANFKNGSKCELSSFSSGNTPFLIEIFSRDTRYIIREPERKYWTSSVKNNWQWEEVLFKTPFVSETTTVVVEDILANGSCSLTPYKKSAKIHMAFLEPLRRFLNKSMEKKYEYYPFT